MNPSSSLQQAAAYLNLQLTHPAQAVVPRPPGPFITISRESGTDGYAFARALATRLPPADDLPWSVYSANLIEEMLRTNQLPPHLARFLPEDRVSEVNASVGELVGLHPNLWLLVAKTNELIRRLARAGQAILLGRGAVFATRDVPNGLHLRLVAPARIRDERVARRMGVDLEKAAAWNARQDTARHRYVKSTFNAQVADPAAYDLVVNVGYIPAETAVELVVEHFAGLRRRAAAGVP